jgi:acyl-CoA thioesterase FadM
VVRPPGEARHAVEDLNARGVNVLVYRVEATFRRAGRLGDKLRVTTEMQASDSPYRIKLPQVIFRGDELVNQAEVQPVCDDANGTLREFP